MSDKKVRTSVSMSEYLVECVNGQTRNFSAYVSEAVEERLRNEGALPKNTDEMHMLGLIRELRAAGFDVEALFSYILSAGVSATDDFGRLIAAALDKEKEEVAS